VNVIAPRITVSKELSQEIREEVSGVTGKARKALIDRIAKRLGFSPITIHAHARKAPGVAITQAPEAPTNGMMVDSFTQDTMGGISVEAAQTDELANLFILQTKIAGWTRQNEDELNQLRELAWKVANTIEALEQARYIANLEFDKMDLQSRLDGATAQITGLQAIIDRENEAKRRRANPETHGE